MLDELGLLDEEELDDDVVSVVDELDEDVDAVEIGLEGGGGNIK